MSSFKKALQKFNQAQSRKQKTQSKRIAKREVILAKSFQAVHDFLKDDTEFLHYLHNVCRHGCIVLSCMNYGTIQRKGDIRGDDTSPEIYTEKNSWRIELVSYGNRIVLETNTRNDTSSSVPFSLVHAPDEVWEALLPTLEMLSDREQLLEFLFKQFPPKP